MLPLKVAISIFLISLSEMASSQSIEITNNQYLNFGTISLYDDIGGTVIVSNTGNRSATGHIALIGSSFSLAAFTIVMDNTQTEGEDEDEDEDEDEHGHDSTDQFSLQIDQPTISLSGSNGGSMSLHIGTSYPELPSVEYGSPTAVYIGGTLAIGPSSANPPGTYSGNVLLYFNFHYE